MKHVWVIVALVALMSGRAFGQCNDYQLSISGTCPGIVTLFWGGAPPGAMQAIIFGNMLGSTTIPPGPCAGTVICIQGSVMMVGSTFSTGSDGTGSVNGTALPSACGKYLIAVANGTPCKVSNPVQIP